MWKRSTLRAGWSGAIVALLVLQGALYLLGSAQGPVSETSSQAVTSVADGRQGLPQRSEAPTPTYVSELAPAVMQAPSAPDQLPASGIERGAGAPWPKLAGFGLAALGVAFVYSALRLGGHESR